ncbi:MAG: hypothetical protein M3680_17890, partial [Myxococcota bacterium]|nr:hypothetical protein [Myxococcota bacterium]
MALDELRTMVAVGVVTPTSARIWARTEQAGPHRLVLTGGTTPIRVEVTVPDGLADHTAAWTIPDDVAGAPPLAPDTAYRFELARADGTPVGAGRFTT